MAAPSRQTLFVRFWSQVEIDPDGCWFWTGDELPRGYGRRGQVLAHRVAWEWATGEKVPAGLVIDHLCRQTSCVRPDHLEAVPQAENVRRGESWHHDDRCVHGHALTPENVYLSPSRGRRCRKCHARRERERAARRRAGL